MADSGAIIDVLDEEDYQNREDLKEDSHLRIEEPTERSQKFKGILESDTKRINARLTTTYSTVPRA